MISAAREDWKTFSYFVVTTGVSPATQAVYVSPDWPSAEEYVKSLAKALTLASEIPSLSSPAPTRDSSQSAAPMLSVKHLADASRTPKP